MTRNIMRVAALALCLLLDSGGARAFHITERLEYDLRWAGIKAGTSMLSIYKDENDMLRIVSTARSTEWIDIFYPVEDLAESTVESDRPWYPIWYHLKTKEGSRRKDKEVRFLRDKGMALYKDNVSGEEARFDVPADVFDPLSAFYHVRFVDLTVGTSSYVPVFDSKKSYDLEVEVLERERVEVPAGTFDTVLIKPVLKSEGIFSRKGPIYIWLTDDKRRIPVKMKTSVAVGSISAELVGGDF